MHFILDVSVGLFDMRSRNECSASAVRVLLLDNCTKQGGTTRRMRDMRIETAAGGQWGSCHRYIAAAQSLLLAAKVIRLSIDIDIDISGCDSPHAAYTQCAVKNRQARQGRQGSWAAV